MADLEKMTAQYVDEGYSELLAEARVCQYFRLWNTQAQYYQSN